MFSVRVFLSDTDITVKTWCPPENEIKRISKDIIDHLSLPYPTIGCKFLMKGLIQDVKNFKRSFKKMCNQSVHDDA